MSTNYFEMFGLPQQYTLDLEDLATRHAALQQKLHPDLHVNATPSEQRYAEMYAAECNEAYRVLADPLERVAYLLRLRGSDPFAEDQTAQLPADFFERQLELHEQLDEIEQSSDTKKASKLVQELHKELETHLKDLGKLLDSPECDVKRAVDEARKLKYLKNSHTKATNILKTKTNQGND